MSLIDRSSNRPDQMFVGIDFDKVVNLEIGALDRPLIPITPGKSYFADYISRDQLQHNHADNKSVSVDSIVNVDFIVGQKTLGQVVPKSLRFDNVFASHVLEHVPDLIGWLDDIAAVTKKGGAVRLIVPNAQECFDRRRSLTQEAEIIEAYLERRRKPSARQVYDFYRWHDREGHLVHTAEQAISMAKASLLNYIDCHCWAFTPQTVSETMHFLVKMQLVKFSVEWITRTLTGEIDFMVGLKRV